MLRWRGCDGECVRSEVRVRGAGFSGVVGTSQGRIGESRRLLLLLLSGGGGRGGRFCVQSDGWCSIGIDVSVGCYAWLWVGLHVL